MSLADKRYKQFLSTYDFFSNNINFRIHSSKALEKWKNVQSFQLNQLINGKFYFPVDRREVLLLKYDLWSRWLYEIENLCIELSGDHLEHKITIKDLEYIKYLAQKTTNKSISIMKNEFPERFDGEFIKIWLEVHEDVNNYLIDSLDTFKDLSYDLFFTRVVDLLVEVMQYTLTEIHEIDMLFCRTKVLCTECKESFVCPQAKRDVAKEDIPYVIVTPLSFKIHKFYGKSYTTKRLMIYRKYFSIDKIYIKNYTNDLIHEDTLKGIEELGVEIDYKKCISKV